MQNTATNNKRIAKNTLLLYFRTFISILVSLYTSRVVLEALGVEDFGIYTVVGGIVIVLGFLNNSMAGATQRFLNFEMGRDGNVLQSVFSSSLAIHFILLFLVFILAETLGLWFFYTQLNIPPLRMTAAIWVYQFSVLSFLVNIISVPYNAAIIAHEKMSAFAYISILDVILKLVVALLVREAPYDHLICYAFLMCIVSVILRIIYRAYCNRHFGECRFKRSLIDHKLVRTMLSFSSWTIVGSLSAILHTQGIAVIINIFFGAAVNAAQGIANQVNNVIKHFITNFLTALNPQIVKNYAKGNLQAMHKLIMQGCRIAFCMVLLMMLPLALEANVILKIWLKTVPEYTVIFVRLLLLLVLLDCFTSILSTAKGATGKIKIYQITLTTIGFFHLPLSWLVFSYGYEPYHAMSIYVFIIILQQVFRIWLVCRSIHMPLGLFYRNVVLRCLLLMVISCIVPILLYIVSGASIGEALLIIVVSVISVSISSLYIGLNGNERDKIRCYIKQKIKYLE